MTVGIEALFFMIFISFWIIHAFLVISISKLWNIRMEITHRISWFLEDLILLFFLYLIKLNHWSPYGFILVHSGVTTSRLFTSFLSNSVTINSTSHGIRWRSVVPSLILIAGSNYYPNLDSLDLGIIGGSDRDNIFYYLFREIELYSDSKGSLSLGGNQYLKITIFLIIVNLLTEIYALLCIMRRNIRKTRTILKIIQYMIIGIWAFILFLGLIIGILNNSASGYLVLLIAFYLIISAELKI